MGTSGLITKEEMIIFELIAFGLTFLNALFNYELIERNKKIMHGLWFLGYAVACFGAYLWLKGSFFIAMVTGLLIRALFFDLLLNYFRGLPITYQSLSTTSIWDKLTRKIPFWPLRMIYAAAIIVLNFIK